MTNTRQQTTLGELIALLESREQDQGVYFDFCYLAPDRVVSYRGYYEHLAVGYREGIGPTVAAFLATLRGAVGSPFSGWKGGDYIMHEGTPLWVSNPGECADTVIVGLRDCSYQTVLATEFQS